ncbi:MAG: NAD(P)/FAD-dependent oxidoreductase, partial [Armatimonadota bacterium]
DLQGILRAAKSADSAIVLGGGCVGLMAASGLHALGLKVTVVIRSPHLLSQVADAEAGEIFRQRFEDNGVSVVTENDVVEVLGDRKVEGARLEDGRVIRCQIIVVGKGVRSNIDLVKDTDIKTRRGILADDELKTSVPDIYAAGDVAETTDIVTGQETVNAIWPAAAEQGRIAGANMAGGRERYAGSMRMNSAEFFGLPLISTGLVKPHTPEDYEILKRYVAEKN